MKNNIIIAGGCAIGKTTLMLELFDLKTPITPKQCIKFNYKPKKNGFHYYGAFRVRRYQEQLLKLYAEGGRIISDGSHAIQNGIARLHEYNFDVFCLDVDYDKHYNQFMNRRTSRPDLNNEEQWDRVYKEHLVYVKKYPLITGNEIKEIINGNRN